MKFAEKRRKKNNKTWLALVLFLGGVKIHYFCVATNFFCQKETHNGCKFFFLRESFSKLILLISYSILLHVAQMPYLLPINSAKSEKISGRANSRIKTPESYGKKLHSHHLGIISNLNPISNPIFE